ncbi:MAG: hypothetical protein WDW38_005960 [Sanguina aurantia]
MEDAGVEELTWEESLAMLPENVREAVESLPREKGLSLMKQLLQLSDLSYRALAPEDVDIIKERTAASGQYGFVAADVDFDWEELSQPSYVSIGCFEEREGVEVPVAFLVGEVCCLEDTREFQEEEETVGSEGLGSLLQAGGWLASDTIMSIYYIGVDFEFRRQGVGKTLLDCAKEVAIAARAKMIWLNVAEYNPSALAFYERYGFNKTDEFKKGERGKHFLCVLPLKKNRAPVKTSRNSKQYKSSAKGFGGGGGSSSGSGSGGGSRQKAAKTEVAAASAAAATLDLDLASAAVETPLASLPSPETVPQQIRRALQAVVPAREPAVAAAVAAAAAAAPPPPLPAAASAR